MKCENVNRGHATSDISINVQNGMPFHGQMTEMSSPFVICLIDNSLLYTTVVTTPDLGQMMLQFFPPRYFRNHWESSFFLLFCWNSFITLFAL